MAEGDDATQHHLVPTLNLHEATETTPVDVIQLSAAYQQPAINKLQADLTRAKPLLQTLGSARFAEMVEQAEPVTPTSTMAWFTSLPACSVGPDSHAPEAPSSTHSSAAIVLGGDTVQSNISHIRMPHGLLSSLLVMASSPDVAEDGASAASSSVGACAANYAHDEMNRTPLHEMSFPSNDLACPWHPSHHLKDSTPAVCSVCKAVSKHSVTEIFNYTSLQHRCVHPMWGSEHATHGLRAHGLVNPNDIDFVDAAGSNSSSLFAAREPPDMLCCPEMHVVCTSCLISHWIERASRCATEEDESCTASPVALNNLPCPVEGCECVFSMNKFWRTIYAPDVYRAAYEKYELLGLLHEMQWFYFIWYPIKLLTTLHWHRARNHPDSLVWCPNGVSSLGECASKVARAEWRWGHTASEKQRTLSFGLARDIRQLHAASCKNGTPQSFNNQAVEERIRQSVNLSCQSLMMWVQESCRILLIDHATGLPLPVGEFDWESSVHVALEELPCASSPELSYSVLCAATRTGAEFIPFPPNAHNIFSARLFRVLHWLAQSPCPKCGFHESAALSSASPALTDESSAAMCRSCRAEWCPRCRRHVSVSPVDQDPKSLAAKWTAFLKPTACRCRSSGAYEDSSFVVQYLDRVSAFFPGDQRSSFTAALDDVTSFMAT